MTKITSFEFPENYDKPFPKDFFDRYPNVVTIYLSASVAPTITKGCIPDRDLVIFFPEGYPPSSRSLSCIPKRVIVVIHINDEHSHKGYGTYFLWAPFWIPTAWFQDPKYDIKGSWIGAYESCWPRYRNWRRDIKEFSDHWKKMKPKEIAVVIKPPISDDIEILLSADDIKNARKESKIRLKEIHKEAKDLATQIKKDVLSVINEDPDEDFDGIYECQEERIYERLVMHLPGLSIFRGYGNTINVRTSLRS